MELTLRTNVAWAQCGQPVISGDGALHPHVQYLRGRLEELRLRQFELTNLAVDRPEVDQVR